ncbi:DUF3857 domain-containing protein [Puniceicoccaceae bacterium K14]|nr:DUF3857 domain-containing protein [Puniceicoccaceae bacterium K14]
MTSNIGSLIFLCLGILTAIGTLAGFIKCLVETRKPEVNKPANLSLAFALFFVFLLSVSLLIASYWQRIEGIDVALTILGLPLVVIGGILAIIGLTQITCLKDRFPKGKLRGITGAGLNSFLFIFLCLITFYGAHDRLLEAYILANEFQSAQSDEPEYQVVETSDSLAVETKSQLYLVAKDYGYKLRVPGAQWSELAAENYNDKAKTGLYNSESRTQVFIIPEPLPTPETTLKELSLNARNNISQISKNSVSSDAVSETVAGIEGLRFNVEVQSGHMAIAYSTWIGIRENISYQLFTSVVDGDIQEAEEVGKFIANGFELTEFDSQNFEQSLVADFTFPELGIKTQLNSNSWIEWTSLRDDAPEAVYGVTLNNQAYFIIVPLAYGELSPSMEDLKTAYLEHVFGQDSGYQLATNDTVITPPYDSCTALQVEFSYSMGDYDNFVRARIYKTPEIAFMVATYLSHANLNENIDTQLSLALDSVSFTPPSDAKGYTSGLSEEQKEFHGSALNEIGLNAYNRNDYVLAKKYFEAAFSLQPGDETLLGNILQTQSELQLYSQGIETYQVNKNNFPGNQRLEARYANFLYNTGQAQEAANVFESLFANEYNNEDDLLEYLNALIDLDQRLLAIEKTKAFIKRTQSWQATRWLASMQSDEGQYDSAEATLQSLKKKRPFDSQIDFDLVTLYYNSGTQNKALDAIKQLDTNTQGQSRFLALKGKIHYAKKEYEKAKENFELALENNPGNTDIKEWLDYAANAIGKSDTEVLKEEITPVEIPQSLLSQIPIPGIANDKPTQSNILRSIIAIEFEPEKIDKTTTYRNIRILDDASLESYKTLSFNYDPFAEKIFINQLDVFDENDQLIASGNPDDFYVMDGADTSMATEDKTLHAPVPGLRKGVTLRYAVTIESHNSPDKFPFTRHFFANRMQSDVIVTAIKTDPQNYQAFASPSLNTLTEGNTTLWFYRDAEPYQWEPYQKDIDVFIPKLELNTPRSDWAKLSDEYLTRIDSKLTLGEHSSNTARKITQGIETDNEKIFAIYKYIQENFNYKAIEFGQRARVPNTSDSTIQNSYGDCKDLSLLAHQLLKSSGVPSQLSLVNSSRKVNPELPSMDQFNHMILYLPTLDGGRFLDCTSRSASPTLKAPLNLSGRHALVLEKGGSQLIKIPDSKENKNRIHSYKDLAITGNNILVKETLTLEGEYAAYFRDYLIDTQPETVVTKMQSLMARIESDVQLDKVESLNLNDSLQPLTLNLKYQIRNNAQPNTDGEIELEIPSIWEQDYLDVQFMAERKNPFELRTPLSFQSNVSIKMEGFATKLKKADWNHKTNSVFHNATSVLKKNGSDDTLEIEHTVNVIPGEHEASEFEDFVISSKNALQPLVRPIVLEPVKPNRN